MKIKANFDRLRHGIQRALEKPSQLDLPVSVLTMHRRWRLLLLVVFVCFQKCSSQLDSPGRIKVGKNLKQSWNEIKDSLGLEQVSSTFAGSELIHMLLKAVKSSSFPTAVANLTNQQCVNDSQLYVHNLFKILPADWARQMYESSGQLPTGYSWSGNIHGDGLFDECLAVRGPEDSSPQFRGQYCSVFLSLAPVDPNEVIPAESASTINERMSMITIFQLINQIFGGLISQSGRVEPKVSEASAISYAFPSVALCLPSSCTANDLGQAVGQLVGTYVIGNFSILTITDENYCFTDMPDPPSFDGPDIAVIVTLSTIGLLVFLATLHEAWRMCYGIAFNAKEDSKAVTVLHCFSALSNGRKLLSMKVTSSSDNLGCLHGIRFLSTLWVVIGHTFILGPYGASHNVNMVVDDGMAWWFQGIANGTVSVDTFFFMSGLLVSYLLLRELERNKGKFNVALFYLHRYLRLTPVYAIILGFISTLIVYMGTGPYWDKVTVLAEGCRLGWWRHLLYIQNLWPTATSYTCMAQTWYLAVDMQLFIVAPLFVYLLFRWPFAGMLAIITALLGTLGANFAVFASYDLQPTIMFTRSAEIIANSNADYYYDLPWTRAPPYIIGVLMGWLLHVSKSGTNNRPMPKIFVAIGWALSVATMVAVIYGLIPYLDENKVPEIDQAITVTYGALHRTAWAMALSWVIFACVRGYGGIIVNRFLSWKGFMPLGRLTYCVYLIHLDYLNVFYAHNRKLLYYTFIDALTTYFGIAVTVFGLAFVVTVTIEASFLNLEKFIFSSATESRPPIVSRPTLDLEKGSKSNGAFQQDSSSEDSKSD